MKLVCQTDIPAKCRITKAVVAGGLFFGLLVLFLVPPVQLPLPVCLFHSITGHSCLTCGMTRSLHALLHGDLAASVRYHLFGPAIFLGILMCLMIFAAEAASGNSFVLCIGEKLRGRIIGTFAILWLVYWGIRLAAEIFA